MDTSFMNLRLPEYAYMFGFLQTDGHLEQGPGNKGRLTVELCQRDASILRRFAALIPYHTKISERQRNTIFKDNYHSVILMIYNQQVRELFLSLGMPYGSKSRSVMPPQGEFSRIDYFRGVFDANGSLGLTGNSFPFASLVTASESVAYSYLSFLQEITGKTKVAKRNQRDDVFNLSVFKEDAQKLAATLYYKDCIALPRKLKAAQMILTWYRPTTMKRITNKRLWTPEEDAFIKTHSISDSIEYLHRTYKSINIRLWRLH